MVNLREGWLRGAIMDRFLESDMKDSCVGDLPKDVHTVDQCLSGPFILQVNEIVNVSVGSGDARRLLLTLTDGALCVYGIEHRYIPKIDESAPAGFKVTIHNANVLRGLLMLGPECLEIIGGSNSNKLTAENPCDMMEALEIGEDKSTPEDEEAKLTPEDKAIPYTCMARFRLPGWKWEEMGDCSAIMIKIQGSICGLCRFEYENRTEYEVLVHFVDGSCESVVCIPHKIVQSRIRQTPEQFTAELNSPLTSDGHIKMKKILDDFLEELFNFMGTLILVMHRGSCYPVVVKMYSTTFLDDSAWEDARAMHYLLYPDDNSRQTPSLVADLSG